MPDEEIPIPQIPNPPIKPHPTRLNIGEGIGKKVKFRLQVKYLLNYYDKTKGSLFEVPHYYDFDTMPELVGRNDIVIYDGEEFTVLDVEIMFVDYFESDNLSYSEITIAVKATNGLPT